jgi:hypothetical protein
MQGRDRIVPCALFCLCDVGANGGRREFFEQVAVLDEAKDYVSGKASTRNARKILQQLSLTSAGYAK